MAKTSNDNHVSTAFWMFAIFVMWIPLVNIVMVILWAFAGENESRKNYFKAIIGWFVIAVIFWFVVLVAGLSPLIGAALHSFLRSLGL
jgi:low temperature requirement protein LtrA